MLPKSTYSGEPDPFEYRRKATECLNLALLAKHGDARRQFWDCAQVWFRLARGIEELEQGWHKGPAKQAPSELTREASLEQRREQADRHLSQGKKIIARQERLIAELNAHGHDSQGALELLDEFQNTQRLHQEDRDWASEELARREKDLGVAGQKKSS